jgi:hypothetical protein
MAKAAPKKTTPDGSPSAKRPEIYSALRGTMGEVVKGARLTKTQAIAERRNGRDVVVCGPVLTANMTLAQQIEGAV